MIVREDLERGADLFQIGDAFDALGTLFPAHQCRQKERRQDGNNGNDHEHLDQGKGPALSCLPERFHSPAIG